MSVPPTLLLADDSVAIQRVVALVFADQPVRLVVAKDGQDAINRMATDWPDLVLADTNMPCVDGYEVARWVRQQPHLSTVPVLLLAGITDPVDEQRLHDSGANGVLEKPFEPSHVISRVKELLGIKGASTAQPDRFVTSPDQKPIKRVLPRAMPAAPPAAAREGEEAGFGADVEPPHGLAQAVSFGSTEVSFADLEGESPFSRVLPGRDGDRDDFEQQAGIEAPRGTPEDWFPEDRPSPPTPARGIDQDLGVQFSPRAATSEGAPDGGPIRAGSHPRVSPGTADMFETLLAAEQSGTSPSDALSGWSTGMTDDALDSLAARVVERLHPQAMRDELQRALGTGLTEAVHHSVATETRAAVAEAVQAAVDGRILGTVRGAVNEAVGAAVPRAVTHSMEEHLSGRLEAAVRESVARAVPAAVEQSLQDVVVSRVGVVVRDTVERELRETVAPAMQAAVREIVAATLQQAVTDAVAAAVPTAVSEAVRLDAAGQVRQVVTDTSERLVLEEIARIRERQG